VTQEEPAPFQMTPRTRDVRPDPPAVDRWPAVRSAFSDLLAECEDIGGRGRAAFDAPRSLTYRAAEAVVIHFADLVEHRLPKARPALVPTELPLQAMRTTRNILAHNYRSADKDMVWNVVQTEIPRIIRAMLSAADEGEHTES